MLANQDLDGPKDCRLLLHRSLGPPFVYDIHVLPSLPRSKPKDMRL